MMFFTCDSLLNSVEIKQDHLNCLSSREKKSLHSNFSNCEDTTSTTHMTLMLFSKENYFELLSPVDIIVLFIPMNVTFCWEDLRGTLMGIVIPMVR